MRLLNYSESYRINGIHRVMSLLNNEMWMKAVKNDDMNKVNEAINLICLIDSKLKGIKRDKSFYF